MNDKHGVLAAPLLEDSRLATELELEAEMEQNGRDRYWRRVADAENRGQHMTLPPVRRLAVHWFDELVATIGSYRHSAETHFPEEDIEYWAPVVLEIDAHRLAAITMESVFALCCNNRSGVHRTSLVRRLGKAAYEEVMSDKLREQERIADEKYDSRIRLAREADQYTPDIQRLPEEYRPWRHFVCRYKNVHCGLLSEWMRRKSGEQMDRFMFTKVGAFLLHCILSSATVPRKSEGGEPVVEAAIWQETRRIVTKGKYTRRVFVKLADDLLDKISEWHERRAGLRPKFMPMVVPPNPWLIADKDDERADMGLVRGGYVKLKGPFISNVHATQREAIKRAASDGSLAPYLDKFNAVQSGANWRVISPVLRVQMEMFNRGGGCFGIPHLDAQAYPPIPDEVDRMEVKDRWIRDRRKVRKINKERLGLRHAFTNTVEMANRYSEFEKFYSPMYACFRGRGYMRPVGLNHHGDDVVRGILSFGDSVPLTGEGVRWLKVRAASMFGMGKVSFDDRVAWADANMDNMIRAALMPMKDDWWTTAKKPWQFLASCFGFADPDGLGSRLPVPLDGSANVYQWYAALTRDEELADMVNLLPNSKPNRAYGHVAGVTLRLLMQDMETRAEAALCRPFVDDDMVKPSTMTNGYGITMLGARNQVKAELVKRGARFADGDNRHYELMERCSMYLANTILKGVEEAFPRVKGTMDWIRRSVSKITKTGRAYSFVTPLGWPMVQPYRKASVEFIRTVCGDYDMAMPSPDDPVMAIKQRSSGPPNTIHPFDATHMLTTGAEVVKDGAIYAPVHDSHWTHASNVPVVAYHVREEWIKLHRMDLLAGLKAQLEAAHGVELDDLPEYGNLDIEQVRHAPYFCH